MENSARCWTKRILITLSGSVVFTLLFVVACRVAVQEMFRGMEQSKATGLSAVGWEPGSMWATNTPVDLARSVSALLPLPPQGLVSRNAQLRSRTSSFDGDVAEVHHAVSAHHGYFDDLRTQSQTGQGRLLSVALAFPSSEFDPALADLKKIGRLVAIAEAGEDSAVKLASQARHLASAQTKLARLQKLRHERTDKLPDVLELEKEISAANEAVVEESRRQDELQSTVAQAHVQFSLLEDYRAPLQPGLDGESLQLRNSVIDGISGILSSVGTVTAVLLEYGVPLIFWLALLYLPARFAWRRFQRFRSAPVSAVS